MNVTIRIPHICPVCHGAKKVNRPPWIGGDQQTWSASSFTLYECQACDGSGIVWSES